MNSSPEKNGGENRRTFIKQATTVAGAVAGSRFFGGSVYGQNQASSTGRVPGANDRIAVAYVGTGKQGMEHVKLQKKYAQDNNIAQVAVCDLYQKHLDESRNFIGLKEADA